MSSHFGTSWSLIKVNIPGVGERAYIYANYSTPATTGGQCLPNPLNLGRQCMYIASTGSVGAYNPGNAFDGLFPVVGDYVTSNYTNPNNGIVSTSCYKVLEIVDEATFNTGTCVSCYNNGYAGNCSDAFITVPPYPGDPNGCLYTNTINPQGIVTTQFGQNQSDITAFINTNCVGCTSGVLPVFTPNMLVNCCDPTETYQLASALIEHITGTGITMGVNQLGINTFTQAFGSDLYIGGAGTGWKCWHLKEEYPPFGPTAYQGTPAVPTVFDSCALLNAAQLSTYQNPLQLPCCITPPQYEWCCVSGVTMGYISSCIQVALGTCNQSLLNYLGGPFQTQQLCVDSGCTPIVVEDCELPAAKLNVLQSKITKFTEWKNKALGK